MSEFQKHLTTAITAVAEACRATRAVQAELDSIRQMTKDDRSPVTVADFAAQAIVCRRLSDELGTIDMVGEESAAELREPGKEVLREAVAQTVQKYRPDLSDDDVLDAIDIGNHDASKATYWTLDPIDGTKGFLRGGQYAVSLALIENGEVVLGALGCPNMSIDFDRPFDEPGETGCIYFATRDGGSWYLPENDITVAPEQIHASADVNLGALRVCESVESSHSKQDDTAKILSHLKATSAPARLDSQCKYAVVGRGQADAYLRLPTSAGYIEKIWDHAAGKLVAEQAGAVVTDVHGKPLDFSTGATLQSNKGVICTAAAIHADIIAAINELGIA
ncbi:MAG: 3'(2'),5'-bisphosphate nucleotidase [Gammaproteobacteria bacterium]